MESNKKTGLLLTWFFFLFYSAITMFYLSCRRPVSSCNSKRPFPLASSRQVLLVTAEARDQFYRDMQNTKSSTKSGIFRWMNCCKSQSRILSTRFWWMAFKTPGEYCSTLEWISYESIMVKPERDNRVICADSWCQFVLIEIYRHIKKKHVIWCF